MTNLNSYSFYKGVQKYEKYNHCYKESLQENKVFELRSACILSRYLSTYFIRIIS